MSDREKLGDSDKENITGEVFLALEIEEGINPDNVFLLNSNQSLEPGYDTEETKRIADKVLGIVLEESARSIEEPLPPAA
jgi:hypothetical protein